MRSFGHSDIAFLAALIMEALSMYVTSYTPKILLFVLFFLPLIPLCIGISGSIFITLDTYYQLKFYPYTRKAKIYIPLVLFLSITINIECTNHGTYPFLRDFLWLHQTADMVKFLLSADPNNSVIHADNPNSIKNRIKIIDGANQYHVTQYPRLLEIMYHQPRKSSAFQFSVTY